MRQARRSSPSWPVHTLLAWLLGAAASGGMVCEAFAQDSSAGNAGTSRSGVSFQPRLSLTQTVTDNLRLAETAEDRALITGVAPGFLLSSRAGSVRGSMDYTLNGLIYTKSNQANRIQHALNSYLSVELISRQLFIDVRGTAGQQMVSAFGTASADSALIDSNRKQTFSLAVSPYLRGELGGSISYELRADNTVTRVKESQLGDSGTQGLTMRLSGASGMPLSWSSSLMQQRQLPRYGRETTVDTADITLNYRPDVDWRFSANGGWQRSDVSSLAPKSDAIYGASLSWAPTPRTTLSADMKHQVFGDTHSLSFEHRMAHSVWRVVDSRNLTVGAVGSVGGQSNYDLLFLQFASIEPDPVKRDLLVRQYLQASGLGTGSTSTSGYLSASTNLTRRQEASMAWLGRRSSVTLSLSQSRSKRLDGQTGTGDDFAQSGMVLQRGFSLALSHRFTPSDSLSLTLSQQQGRGDSSNQSSDLKSLTGNWNVKLARRSSLQLGARHSSYDSVARRYRENALFATLVQQF